MGTNPSLADLSPPLDTSPGSQHPSTNGWKELVIAIFSRGTERRRDFRRTRVTMVTEGPAALPQNQQAMGIR